MKTFNKLDYQREYMRKKRAAQTACAIVEKPTENILPVPDAKPSKDVDAKIWAYAVVRAERARRYALKMPEFVRPNEIRFQDPAWQYERELRYAREFTH